VNPPGSASTKEVVRPPPPRPALVVATAGFSVGDEVEGETRPVPGAGEHEDGDPCWRSAVPGPGAGAGRVSVGQPGWRRARAACLRLEAAGTTTTRSRRAARPGRESRRDRPSGPAGQRVRPPAAPERGLQDLRSPAAPASTDSTRRDQGRTPGRLPSPRRRARTGAEPGRPAGPLRSGLLQVIRGPCRSWSRKPAGRGGHQPPRAPRCTVPVSYFPRLPAEPSTWSGPGLPEVFQGRLAAGAGPITAWAGLEPHAGAGGGGISASSLAQQARLRPTTSAIVSALLAPVAHRGRHHRRVTARGKPALALEHLVAATQVRYPPAVSDLARGVGVPLVRPAAACAGPRAEVYGRGYAQKPASPRPES